MSDIKVLCRGKRKDNNEWAKGFYHCVTDNYTQKNRSNITTFKELDNGEIVLTGQFEVFPETVSLYIGRNDRKGNPIFGGDIFFIYGEYDNGLYTEDRSGYVYVYYNDEWCQWELRNFNGEWLDSFHSYMEEPFEDEREGCVCGNIHDDPELMKG